MTTFLQFLIIKLTYLGLILILLAAGFGAPIPEDIPLAFAGHLCHPEYSPIPDVVKMVDTDHDGIPDKEIRIHRVPHVTIMILAGLIGVLTGDTFVFYVGRHGIDSNNFVARHIRKVMHSKRRQRAERHFLKHGYLTVFAGRFMPGARSLVFAMAGMSKMSYPRFILIDGLAAAISVPAFVLLGWWRAADIDGLIRFIGHVKHIVFPIAAAAVLIALTLYYFHKRRPQLAPDPSDSPAATPAKSPHPHPESRTPTHV